MSRRSGTNKDQYLSEQQLKHLNSRQREIFHGKVNRFAAYLEKEGKEPKKGIGYAEDSIPERVSRFMRAVTWIWNNEELTIEITPEHADRVVDAMATDSLRKYSGESYAEGSKRKIVDTLTAWFNYRDVDWESEVSFSEEGSADHADPFSKRELRQLWQTALEYKSIPSYNNLSPDERDRWKAHIAQEIGKPKQEVGPDDWDKLNNRWDIPSLIRTGREAGWRPALVGRLSINWYSESDQTIYIPAGMAPKNDAAWEQKLSDEAAHALENHLEQRKNMEIYDGRDLIWLNREGNPYDSASLNNLLRNLMDEAGINYDNRKLVWYSFRHSIGTYVYEEYKNLKPVADQLRQKSLSSAERYVHSTEEVKKEVASIM